MSKRLSFMSESERFLCEINLLGTPKINLCIFLEKIWRQKADKNVHHNQTRATFPLTNQYALNIFD